MTLLELANQVSTVTGFVEDDDLSAAKSFLTAKHRLMWNHQLWKDSLVEYNVTLSPDGYTPDSVWLPTAGVLLLPDTIQKVLAVRSSDYHMNVQRQEYYYRIDFNAFASQGAPYEFVVLPPAVWQMDDNVDLKVVLGNADDVGTVITLDILKVDGVSYYRYPLTTYGTETYGAIPPGRTNQIGSIIKSATSGVVTIQCLNYPISVLSNTTLSAQTFVTVDEDGITASYVVAAGQTQQVDARFNSITVGIFEYEVSPALSGTFTFNGSSIQRAETVYSIVEMLATDLVAPKRQRIRFVRIPSDETTVRVLGKRNPPSFSNNSDEPAITGCEDYLIAFASAQMWERARQFGKKQLLMQEADALLGDLIKQETVQQAHHISITPETGMGGDYYAYGRYSGIAW